uniref:NADH-ubiquinone oxidoreductase chain 4L n=1 Tax=Abacion magnum TaxID=118452 RepID=S4T028_ABAMA|nr:NADH dehydrogenase subunit 4L [Abacion magnum]AFR77021.1 NADH dehydrogenase subunit 4L [Abacion magnum]
MMMLGMMMVVGGLLGFLGVYKHALSMLLSLEFMVLGLVMLLGGVLSLMIGEGYFMLVLFTFGACEGALGLSIIVSFIRSHGSEYIFNLSVMEC